MDEINIELSGFRDIDESSMEIVNKTIGAYARKMAEHMKEPGTLHITLKPVHEREKSEKYELHARIRSKGKMLVSEFTERNLLTAVDTVLKKLLTEVTRQH